MLLMGWLVSGLALLVAVPCAVFGDFTSKPSNTPIRIGRARLAALAGE